MCQPLTPAVFLPLPPTPLKTGLCLREPSELGSGSFQKHPLPSLVGQRVPTDPPPRLKGPGDWSRPPASLIVED